MPPLQSMGAAAVQFHCDRHTAQDGAPGRYMQKIGLPVMERGPMRPLSLAQHTLYADLLEQGDEDLFDPRFPENGSVLVRHKASRNETARGYAYYQGYQPAAGGHARGRRYSRYVGPIDDPAVGEWIARFRRIKAVRAERSSTVDALIGSGMPRPSASVGRLLEGLAKAGLFPSRAVLIGAAAYQTYSGVLGVRLSKSSSTSRDADLAQFDQISVYLKDRILEILDLLHGIDPSFAPALDIDDKADALSFRNERQIRISFLTAHHDDNRHTSGAMTTHAPGHTAAGCSRLLDFLVNKPVRTIVLHGPGIEVSAPSPERYAVHALIVAGQQSIAKDRQVRTARNFARAAEVIEALSVAGRERALIQVFAQAWEREPTWRIDLLRSVGGLPEVAGTILRAKAAELNVGSPVPASPRSRNSPHGP